MATLSKSGITTGQSVESWHITQSIDAFSGLEAYDITLSGLFTLQNGTEGADKIAVSDATGSITFTGSFSELAQSSTDFYNFTSSYNNFTSSYNTGSFSGSFTGDFTGSISSASYAPNFANTDLTFDSNRAHDTNGFNYQLTFDNGVFAKGWQTLSETESSIGCGNQYVNINDANIRFYTSGSERAIISNNGSVGIGKNTPNATLDVSGSLTVTGSISFTGGLIVSQRTVDASTDEVLTINDHTLFVSSSSPSGNLYFPSSPIKGQQYVIYRIQNTNTFTIQGNGKNINNASTFAFPTTQYTMKTFTFDGTSWWTNI